MTVVAASDVYYDPYDVEINADPYPVYRRLREEPPLYYNEPYDFFALSRYADVDRGLVDKDTYSSARGASSRWSGERGAFRRHLHLEDPPIHSVHRGLMSRVFTPEKMNALEAKVREFCAHSLDPLIGAVGSTSSPTSARRCPCGRSGCCWGFPKRTRTTSGAGRTLHCAPSRVSR